VGLCHRYKTAGCKDGGGSLSYEARALDRGSLSAGVAISLGALPTLLLFTSVAIQLAFWQQQTQLVADVAALSASETARGLISGFSCENPEQIATRFDLELDRCRIVGFSAFVEVSKSLPPFRLFAQATAGPPKE
jgi:hypothetical protein